jgi:hypothetical protein
MGFPQLEQNKTRTGELTRVYLPRIKSENPGPNPDFNFSFEELDLENGISSNQIGTGNFETLTFSVVLCLAGTSYQSELAPTSAPST